MPARATTTALLAAAALGTAGCGSDKQSASSATAPVTTAEAPETTTVQPPDVTVTTPPATPTTPAEAPAKPKSISKNLKSKPEIPRPTGTPPARLVVRDIVKGTGKKARTGDSVTVQYVGVSYSTGEQFDASWDNGKPFEFQLGDQQIIPGWNQGVAGMKAGGRRELVIPPDLAYGAQGRPGIAPNETLVFVIDLLKVD